MNIEIRLTEDDLAPSAVFIHFLAHWLDGGHFPRQTWAEQISEKSGGQHRKLLRSAPYQMDRLLAHDKSRQLVARSYRWLHGLITGNRELLHDMQARHQFVNVIGIPRNGGSYLTQELFTALGHNVDNVPSGIAHDGFPEAAPFRFSNRTNSWIVSLQTTAEYLTMVECFFEKSRRHRGKIIVPKKLTKAVYAGPYFGQVFGRNTINVFTLRHPVSTCISTYEKSGGLPAHGKFMARSTIERWIRRDLMNAGHTRTELAKLDYFEAFLLYWEQYHAAIATSGLALHGESQTVVYGRDSMRLLAATFHRRYRSQRGASDFHVSPGLKKRHPGWFKRAHESVERIAELWGRAGLGFELAHVMECW